MLFLALIIAAALLGGGLLRRLGVRAGLEGTVFALLLGALILGAGLLPVARVSLNAAGAVLVVGALLLMTREVTVHRHRVVPRQRPPGPRLDALETVCAVALGAMGMTVVLRALAPVVHPEALTIHLPLAKEAVLSGRLAETIRHPMTSGDTLGATLRAVLYLWRSALSVALWQSAVALLAVAALYALVRRLGTRRAALLAAAGFAAMPAFLSATLTLGDDLLAAAFVFAAMTAVVRWKDEGHAALGVIGGVLMAGACASHAIGWMALPGWVVLVALAAPLGILRSLVYAGLPAVLLALPWLAVMPAPVEAAEGVGRAAAWLAHNGLPPADLLHARSPVPPALAEGRVWWFPWDAVMRPLLQGGPGWSPGPLPVVLGLPALLIGGRRQRGVAAFALVFLAMVWLFLPGARLLLVPGALLIALAATGLDRTRRLRRLGVAVFVVAVALGVALHAASAAGRVRVLAGLDSVEAFRTAHVPAYPAMAWCNAQLHEGTVLSFEPRAFLLDAPAFVDYAALVSLSSEPIWVQTARLREWNIRFILYPERAVLGDAGLRAAGIPAMVRAWQNHPQRFLQRAVFALPDGSPVYVYEVMHRDTTR